VTKRSRRYPSAQALLDDLRRHRDGLPVRARPDTLSYRLATFVRRHRTAVVAAGLVLLTLLAGVAGTTWQAVRASEQAQVAAAERDRARRETAKAEEVKTFLIDLFEAADPNELPQDNLTAFEILEAGAERVETELAD
jgi:serine/threonine-protein kinase